MGKFEEKFDELMSESVFKGASKEDLTKRISKDVDIKPGFASVPIPIEDFDEVEGMGLNLLGIDEGDPVVYFRSGMLYSLIQHSGEEIRQDERDRDWPRYIQVFKFGDAEVLLYKYYGDPHVFWRPEDGEKVEQELQKHVNF